MLKKIWVKKEVPDTPGTEASGVLEPREEAPAQSGSAVAAPAAVVVTSKVVLTPRESDYYRSLADQMSREQEVKARTIERGLEVWRGVMLEDSHIVDLEDESEVDFGDASPTTEEVVKGEELEGEATVREDVSHERDEKKEATIREDVTLSDASQEPKSPGAAKREASESVTGGFRFSPGR